MVPGMTPSRMTPEEAKRLSLAEQHDWFRSATSRRSLLRGGVIGAGAAIAGPALLTGTASAATASAASPASAANPARQSTPLLLAKGVHPNGASVAPFGKHLAFGADPTTSMAVAWQVPALVSNPFIRIGHSPHDLSQQIQAEIRNLTTPTSDIQAVDAVPPSASGPIEQYYVHATLSGLRPGKTYYYSVGHSGWDFSGDVASLGSFTTATDDSKKPFTFTAFGDEGVSYDAVGNTNLIRAQGPAFHLHAGDISYAESGGGGLVTDPYDPRIWDSFFTEIEPAAASIPWQVAVGNHEMEAWYSPDGYGGQHARFDFPGQPNYYSFVYGNVGVISLDANDVSYEIPANNGYSGGAQVAWLQSTLASLRANPSVDFIVAYFHHCAYSTCTVHGCEGGAEQFFVPLFDQYQVDLVINGHNHIYERTDPLRGGNVTSPALIGSTVYPATAGTTYICAGGGGESLYSFPVSDSYEGHVDDITSIPTFINVAGGNSTNENVTWSRVRYTGYCLLVMTSNPRQSRHGTSSLQVRGLAEDGSELDSITLVR
jgi:Purple acid Phosphatase, N-terminal domain/Calcineurin-like phosphoesterase